MTFRWFLQVRYIGHTNILTIFSERTPCSKPLPKSTHWTYSRSRTTCVQNNDHSQFILRMECPIYRRVSFIYCRTMEKRFATVTLLHHSTVLYISIGTMNQRLKTALSHPIWFFLKTSNKCFLAQCIHSEFFQRLFANGTQALTLAFVSALI